MKKNKGFTFIEVMTVVTIITIMTAVAIVSLSSARTETKLKAAQREVASAIKLAQSYALQGRMCGEDSPKSYKFEFGSGGIGNYGIYCNTTDEEVESHILANGVEFSGSGEISFSVPHADVGFGGGATLLTITVKLGTPQKTVTVNDKGMVMED